MTVQITHIRYTSSTPTHESITHYRWVGVENNSTGSNSKAEMVYFLDNQNGQAVVGSGASRVKVGTVHPDHGQPYLRTYADGRWNNNLLSLPTF